jgi:hypothetical protein
MGDGSLQSHSGANLNPKTAKDRGNVPKGGEAGGVALTLWQIIISLSQVPVNTYINIFLDTSAVYPYKDKCCLLCMCHVTMPVLKATAITSYSSQPWVV